MPPGNISRQDWLRETHPIFPPKTLPPSPSFPAWRKVADRARSYLVSKEATALLDMWLAVGSDRRPPSRQTLKPDHMGRILADVWLMDYLPEERRLRYRLTGANIQARYDDPLVGRCLDEILASEARDRVLAYFLTCVERPAICIVVGRLYHEWRQPAYGERLLLPLLSKTGEPEGLIGITICKQTFASQAEAEERARRVIAVLPLDGSAPSEETS